VDWQLEIAVTAWLRQDVGFAQHFVAAAALFQLHVEQTFHATARAVLLFKHVSYKRATERHFTQTEAPRTNFAQPSLSLNER
jgi:hypothetical protein